VGSFSWLVNSISVDFKKKEDKGAVSIKGTVEGEKKT